MHTCGSAECETSLQACGLINVFQEIKKDPDRAHFLLESAYMAYNSGVFKQEKHREPAGELVRDFPSYILKR